jgi:ABC-type branched-subunit amino acid transport system ATPase component
MVDYEITIENCNSIDSANIVVTKGCLNIKFGPNGLGKSTIAKAIVSQARNDGTLVELVPFKSREKEGAAPPKVDGIGDINSALVFDEAYVNLFAFQQDEVVKNSFDIFIKTPEYDSAMAEIEKLFDGIKKAFADKPEIEQTTNDKRPQRP